MNNSDRSIFPWLLPTAALSLTGCATEVTRIPSPAPLIASDTRTSRFVLAGDIHLELPTAYTRVLKRHSKWIHVGKIPQGDVLRPDGTTLTVEGAHVHEAYIVVSDGKLVGFYLPVEKAFSPLPNPLPVLLTQ